METRDFRKTEMRNCENEVKRIKYNQNLFVNYMKVILHIASIIYMN